MAKYLEKTIEDERTGNEASAWIAGSLNVDVVNKTARISELGFKDINTLRAGKQDSVNPVRWEEPDITILKTDKEYPVGTKLEDIIFDVLAQRMVTMDKKPGGRKVNPLIGAIIKDI